MIVNAAAHTAVDKAESEPELARTINALAPGVLAQEAAARQRAGWCTTRTDYVFDGSGAKPWAESDADRAAECVRRDQAGRRAADTREPVAAT